jgi:hypothetical protein
MDLNGPAWTCLIAAGCNWEIKAACTKFKENLGAARGNAAGNWGNHNAFSQKV